MSTLKSYVRNRSYPEGSIVEAYMMEECVNFCSRYLEDVETKFNKIHRNDDTHSESGESIVEFPIFSNPGHHIGRRNSIALEKEIITKAHQYVLFNCGEIESFIDIFHSAFFVMYSY